MTLFLCSRVRRARTALLTGFALASFLVSPASAQTPAASAPPPSDDQPVASRAEALAREQAAKALMGKPYERSRAEKAIKLAENLLISPPTIYPWLGSVYPGGLFAIGAGVRKPMGDTGSVDVHGGYSLKGYAGLFASVHLPELANGRIRVDLRGQYINAPKVGFFGLGQDTVEDARTNFLYRPAMIGGTVTVEPLKGIAIGGGVDYLDARTDAAGGGTVSSIEERFDEIDAPGLGASPRYVRTTAFAGYDWRSAPGYSTHGGWYHVEWYDYRQQNDGNLGFQRTDAEIQQFIPLMRANWVLAFRGLVSTTETKDGDEVPYFLMPDLGGANELRGYTAFRFRDRHRLLLTGEYRWRAGQFVDMALFMDAGKVTANRRDLDFNDLDTAYGIGVRFHTLNATVLRVDVAKTRKGIGLVFTAGQIF